MRPDVRRWYDRRSAAVGTASLAEVLRAKRDTRTSVAVVMPALDEEATVGHLVSVVRRELMDRAPLVDELVVMDSGSTDATAAVAAGAGATVWPGHEVLPRLGVLPGKGEMLWKALYVTRSDVVVYVDADLRSFGPEYVTGLVWPLLTDPSLQFVKASYDRALGNTGDTADPAAEGGRVTELVARPLLNLHWPELAGFVQPLGGEYAARRRVLEQVPFVTGYGVELGLLVDLLDLVGLDAMAQVHLGRRVHRHHDHRKLGLMATEIWLTALDRLARSGRLTGDEPRTTTITQFAPDPAAPAHARPVTSDVVVRRRPPMATVPEYRDRGLRAS